MSGPGLAYADRVLETSTTTGTGALTLGGATTGYQAFSSAFVTGQTVYYTIVNTTTGAWETGQGTYTTSSTSLSRDVVFASSASGALVSFTGTVNVWADIPARAIADRGLAVAFAAAYVPI